MLNLHHLELFYHVAKHRGISAAVKKMPWGVQQPAVSLQLAKLEADLGLPLFTRRPFALTPAGAALQAHLAPFFDGLPALEAGLRRDGGEVLRIGAAEMIQRDHLPALFARLRVKRPALRLQLRDGIGEEFIEWVRGGELDFAVVAGAGRPPRGLKALPLATVPLALAIAAKSPHRDAEALWRAAPPPLPLLCLPPAYEMCREFQAELARRDAAWAPALELASLQLVQRYAAEGFGAGLVYAPPFGLPAPGVRLLPLAGFPSLEFRLVWNGRPTPLRREFLAALDGLMRQVKSRG